MLLFKTLHIMKLATTDRMVSKNIAAEESAKNPDDTLFIECNL
ncbi:MULTISPECIES: hypothetical protein [Lacrimispora]|nr:MULTISPECIES: hypothetical protein [Lacrimispora]MDR7814582.1 hypothetical protein [Lacrimispora sp.]